MRSGSRSSGIARTAPSDSRTAAVASSSRAGFPIRIAVATVCGFATGRPVRSGAAPSAWPASIRGATPDSRKPFQ